MPIFFILIDQKKTNEIETSCCVVVGEPPKSSFTFTASHLTHSKRRSRQEAVAKKAFHKLGLPEELKNSREENKNLRVQIEQERAQHRAAIQQLQIQHKTAIQQLQIQHRAAIQQLQAAIQQLQIQQQQTGPVGQGALNHAPPQNPNGPPGGAQEQQQPVVGPTGLASGPALPKT